MRACMRIEYTHVHLISCAACYTKNSDMPGNWRLIEQAGDLFLGHLTILLYSILFYFFLSFLFPFSFFWIACLLSFKKAGHQPPCSDN